MQFLNQICVNVEKVHKLINFMCKMSGCRKDMTQQKRYNASRQPHGEGSYIHQK